MHGLLISSGCRYWILHTCVLHSTFATLPPLEQELTVPRNFSMIILFKGTYVTEPKSRWPWHTENSSTIQQTANPSVHGLLRCDSLDGLFTRRGASVSTLLVKHLLVPRKFSSNTTIYVRPFADACCWWRRPIAPVSSSQHSLPLSHSTGRRPSATTLIVF